MMALWRRLALAAALFLAFAAGAAHAQTVMVINAPAGSTVDVAVNAAVVGTAVAGPDGRAAVPLGPGVLNNRPSANVRLFVDTCSDRRRVVVAESALAPMDAGTCSRRDISGVFRLLPVSTFVVDLQEKTFTVRLRQGPAPERWFLEETEETRKGPPVATPRAGFMLFADTGVLALENVVSVYCGNVSDCSGTGTRLTGEAGLTIWLTKYLALEAAYVKHRAATVAGKDAAGTYTFDSTFSSHIFKPTIKVGLPLERVRPYVFGGVTYTWSTATTTQTINDSTVTVDDQSIAIPGGTQDFELKTRGWGWTGGAGLEVPVSKRWTTYVEAGRLSITGDDTTGGEGQLGDAALMAFVGVRFRLGR